MLDTDFYSYKIKHNTNCPKILSYNTLFIALKYFNLMYMLEKHIFHYTKSNPNIYESKIIIEIKRKAHIFMGSKVAAEFKKQSLVQSTSVHVKFDLDETGSDDGFSICTRLIAFFTQNIFLFTSTVA